MVTPTPDDVVALVERFCTEQELDHERGARPGEVVVVLPGEKKLKTVVSLQATARGLSTVAFVIRNPDEAHERFYRTLLRRNLTMPGLAYAIDDDGDTWVRGVVPLAAVDEDHLDRLLGAVLEAADAPFNELLAIGFISSMRKEWAWRTSRGEPTFNLEAFRHLLEPGAEAKDAEAGAEKDTENDTEKDTEKHTAAGDAR